jgi:hypothetical protein
MVMVYSGLLKLGQPQLSLLTHQARYTLCNLRPKVEMYIVGGQFAFACVRLSLDANSTVQPRRGLCAVARRLVPVSRGAFGLRGGERDSKA